MTDQYNSQEYKILKVEGGEYLTLYTKKYEGRQAFEFPDERNLLSVLPGTTLEVLVQEGDCVKAGQNVIVFEAMKMLNTIQSTRDGVIKKINAVPGESFPKNFILLEME